jgi:hypothetical protein
MLTDRFAISFKSHVWRFSRFGQKAKKVSDFCGRPISERKINYFFFVFFAKIAKKVRFWGSAKTGQNSGPRVPVRGGVKNDVFSLLIAPLATRTRSLFDEPNSVFLSATSTVVGGVQSGHRFSCTVAQRKNVFSSHSASILGVDIIQFGGGGGCAGGDILTTRETCARHFTR